MNKKAFTLLITLVCLVSFSFLSIQILQTKAVQNDFIKNRYLYLQAYNHKEFLKEYLKSKDLENISKIEISNKDFLIYAKIKKEDKYFLNLYVKSKKYNISLHEEVIK